MPDQEDETLMARYGITAETQIIYRYEGYTYQKLDDAIRYAKKQADESES